MGIDLFCPLALCSCIVACCIARLWPAAFGSPRSFVPHLTQTQTSFSLTPLLMWTDSMRDCGGRRLVAGFLLAIRKCPHNRPQTRMAFGKHCPL